MTSTITLTNTKARYGAVPQLIHWLTALAVLCGWALGQFGDALPKGGPHETGLVVHMVIGEVVFLLVLVRLIWRAINPPPPFEPTPFGWLAEWAARLSHFALYALLVIVPVFGMLVQINRGHDLPIFGLGSLPAPWPADRPAARTTLEIHMWLADTLLTIAGVHAVAAIVHHWVWHDRTLSRMLPGKA
jgi:cytochrome b561